MLIVKYTYILHKYSELFLSEPSYTSEYLFKININITVFLNITKLNFSLEDF